MECECKEVICKKSISLASLFVVKCQNYPLLWKPWDNKKNQSHEDIYKKNMKYPNFLPPTQNVITCNK